MITYLVEAGADPNARDMSGVAPLHRAVRNRCSKAVGALIDSGADPVLRNTSGSTPLHLAVQNTGKSHSGSARSRDEQGRIPGIRALLAIDSLSAAIGGLFGASSVTAYIESAAGVAEGARTGLHSVFVGLMFLAAIFLASDMSAYVTGSIVMVDGGYRTV